MLLTALPLTASRVLIYNASSAGSTVDVIDSATNKVVQKIESIELPHDVAFSADGSRVYISDEAENMLDVVDQKTGQLIKKVPLSGKPNTLVATKDGGAFLSRSTKNPARWMSSIQLLSRGSRVSRRPAPSTTSI